MSSDAETAVTSNIDRVLPVGRSEKAHPSEGWQLDSRCNSITRMDVCSIADSLCEYAGHAGVVPRMLALCISSSALGQTTFLVSPFSLV